ncbi:hypothetical protein TCAL_01182 [Tigriopus californicus]|uniref:Small integral membrane protein 4 n=1 Tax=Tigriopus californicus TaxID=6832 RepID=A0A553NZ61_TIGCA|nr:ubiquinol-cytochrome-c reductase complex assembly factor 5-like [Tigriopus californicus]TRY70729.1 hypothetical protein TCAL_01182 [Tigriopus californicus]|eukprot:TCALIF_01182-PA protein Name:"Similar to CG32736 Small integral membrane protein 4 (Drosophila melanogaster)" AED:0.00 eAED:0.00 QI:86/1/1/1/0/0.5/2/520/82
MSRLSQILKKVPGKQQFGVFRFLPFMFLIGAGVELTMIKVYVGPVNFYQTYKKRIATDIVVAEEREQLRLERRALQESHKQC